MIWGSLISGQAPGDTKGTQKMMSAHAFWMSGFFKQSLVEQQKLRFPKSLVTFEILVLIM